ncbi:hypothetical protein IW140_000056 [Coemansia sp. RSA 1813]|nr:hypothetical protein EV178_000142 [Coemansia sp. RSA 1646]KAJ1771388.1 hypothetical protein LPJ74_002428 [Coemansia sp. RSA 1843]KAJ2093161.1 hypothetical protein IW138_000453 [Coemansia sp. RSA 986]KAJ2217573.1 hypothetical protein EV179_000408 [Coemansia sp. RSA 487]KAJ2573415.1 hypothetical protein IW140_000056 [Coemansia sp. RSA 1813]
MTAGTIPDFVRNLPLPEPPTLRRGASLAVRFILALTALSAVLVSSITLYGIFYKLYVPQLMHESPVYFQYPTENTGVNTTARVTFVPETDYKFLSTSQAYTVSLDMDVPTSETNQQLGNFMVYLEMQTRRGVVVGQSARPAIMPYRSRVVRLLQTAVRAVPLALGLSRETDVLHVELVDVLYDRHFSPITSARIALSKPLQVYGARLVICAQFSGLRYWMYYWRLPTAIVFVSAAVAWQILFTAGAWSVLESYTTRAARRNEHDVSSATATSDLNNSGNIGFASDGSPRSRYTSVKSLATRKKDRTKKRRRPQQLRRVASENRERSVPAVEGLSALDDDNDDDGSSIATMPELQHVGADNDSRRVPDDSQLQLQLQHGRSSSASSAMLRHRQPASL